MSKHGNREINMGKKYSVNFNSFFFFFLEIRATSMVELCTAYFFIGHRGSLTKEDVRSAYDVSIPMSPNTETQNLVFILTFQI
jgi:hypothetical protein